MCTYIADTGFGHIIPRVVTCINKEAVSYTHLDVYKRQIEGLETARRSGKQLGRPRGRCITEKERKAKNIILKRDTLFGGDLCPSDCMKVIGISRGTYYKYRNDLSKFPIA